jgi:hypothetical protein
MNVDIWYDLMIRELSDRIDPAKELLAEAAAAALPEPELEVEAPSGAPAAAIAPPLCGRRRLVGS